MRARDNGIVFSSIRFKCLKYIIFFAKLIAYIGTNNAISHNVSNLVIETCLGGELYGGQTFTSFPGKSCCISCDFDRICIERKTCCDDRWRHISDYREQVCLPGKREQTLKRSVIHSQANYLVRAHCPRSFPNYDIRKRCEQDEPSTLEDIPFVSSKNGEIIYKNRHCALCHGEINPVVWKVYFDHTCIRRVFLPRYYSDPFQNASMINDMLINSCTLYFDRPDIAEEKWKRLTCAPDGTLISDCPEMTSTKMASGNAEEELNDLCLKDRMDCSMLEGGLSAFHVHNRWFTNVYCYLCNKRLSGKCHYSVPHKVLPSISILIDLSFLHKRSSTRQDKRCRDDHFYDPFFDTCRHINCQMFETAVAGRCVSFVLKSKLNYAFDIEFVATNPLNTTDLTIISKNLSLSFPRKFGFERCTVCSVKISFDVSSIGYGGQGNVSFYMSFIYSTSPTCEWTYLHSRADWLHRTGKLSLFLGNVMYKIKYFSSSEEYLSIMRRLGTIGSVRSCPFYYPGEFSCPWTTLSPTEMDELRKMAGNSSTLMIRRNKNDNFALCIDEYKDILRDINSNSAKNKDFPVVMALISIAVVILKD